MRGFSLIEVIVYIAVLALVSVIAVETMLSIQQSLSAVRVTRALSSAEALAMGRMMRLVRSADSVVLASSTLNVSPGVLTLRGPEPSSTISSLSLINGKIFLSAGNDPLPRELTPEGITVSNLVFRYITASTTSRAVKIEVSLTATTAKASTTQNIYGTAVLRNSYAP